MKSKKRGEISDLHIHSEDLTEVMIGFMWKLQRHKLTLNIKELGIPNEISSYFHSGLRKKIKQLKTNVIKVASAVKTSLESIVEGKRQHFKDSNHQ